MLQPQVEQVVVCNPRRNAPRYREEWLNKIAQAGVRRRAELLYQQLDGLQALRRNLRPEFLAEGRKHKPAVTLISSSTFRFGLHRS
jgi:hypothetical protein